MIQDSSAPPQNDKLREGGYMYIGIDVSAAVNQQAGIGRYTRELVKSLQRIDDQNIFHLFSFYGDESAYFREVGSGKNVELESKHYPGRFFRLMLLALYKSGISPDFLVRPLDVFHSPDHVFPACKKIPTVLTIHDLAFLLYPENYTRINRAYLASMIPQSVKNAAKVVTDANNTKEDLMRLLQVPEGKIQVIHPGIESTFHPVPRDEGNEIRIKYHLPESYVLYVGTLEPRKNIASLIRAYAKVRKNEGVSQGLVICGGLGWLYQDLFKLVRELGLQNEIIFTGHVPNEHLPAIYSGAELLVYPSIYEGFGLPVLEAMACGTPVITSTVSSLPEVAGDAALLVNPYDVEELASAIEKVLSDSELRTKLITKGLERARLFSWEKTARETLAVYQEVGQGL
jgi:glycosyltransferase involved in cell wall biosynthesis